MRERGGGRAAWCSAGEGEGGRGKGTWVKEQEGFTDRTVGDARLEPGMGYA